MKVNVGDTAPDFTLTSQKGENVTLSQFRGKKNVILYFYPKDETPGCTREACTFRDSFELFTDLGAEVIGVSADTVESHKAFTEHHGLPFTLLSDVDNAVRKLYGATSTLGLIPGRVTFIIDKEGVVRERRELKQDNAELRGDRRELHQDKKELKHDRRELHRDRHQTHRAKRSS